MRTKEACLLATIDVMMLHMMAQEGALRRQRMVLRDQPGTLEQRNFLSEQEGTLRRRRVIYRMAATHLRLGRQAHVVMALLLEQDPELDPAVLPRPMDHAS